MNLEQIAAGTGRVPLQLIGADKDLVAALQKRLAEIGLLDPPADGVFGPVSRWAIDEFLRATGQGEKEVLDSQAARALLSDGAVNVFPRVPTTSFAGRLCDAAEKAGYWLSHHPACVNILYVEGMGPDGQRNANPPDEFNDSRLVVRIAETGEAELLGAWEATTEPGRHYTSIDQLSPLGAARIAFGQFKAWSIGQHKDHRALVQTAPIRIHRDLNRDFMRDGDRFFDGLFGINQHWGYDMPKKDIGKASAGCLVGRTRAGHRLFIGVCESDARYEASRTYRFMTGVLPGAKVAN